MSGVVTRHSLMPHDGEVEYLTDRIFDGFRATIDLPIGATIIAVGDPHGVPTVWAVSSGEGGRAPSKFLVVADDVHGDGVRISGRDHVGSILRADGTASWHIFWTERGDLQ